MLVAPCTLFAKRNTNMLSNLRIPDDSTDNRTKRRTRPITSLIPISIIRTLGHTFIRNIFPKQSRRSGTLNHTDGHLR